jgi:hypothetical protein
MLKLTKKIMFCVLKSSCIKLCSCHIWNGHVTSPQHPNFVSNSTFTIGVMAIAKFFAKNHGAIELKL